MYCSTTSRSLESTGEVVSEHLTANHFALGLSGSIWEHLEGSVWLFRVAELFSCDFKTMIHFADIGVGSDIYNPYHYFAQCQAQPYTLQFGICRILPVDFCVGTLPNQSPDIYFLTLPIFLPFAS